MRALVIADKFRGIELGEGLAGFGVDVEVVPTVEDAAAALGVFWPDAVVVDVPWTPDISSWVYRNLTRYWVRTVVTSKPGGNGVREATYVAAGADVRAIAGALRGPGP